MESSGNTLHEPIRKNTLIPAFRVVTENIGKFEDPQWHSYNIKGNKESVYRVRFRQVDIWPIGRYEGSDNDVVSVEIFHPWLELSSESAYLQQCSENYVDALDSQSIGSSEGKKNVEQPQCSHKRSFSSHESRSPRSSPRGS